MRPAPALSPCERGIPLIQVSRLNKEPFFINPDLIEFIEETPDTVISMDSGRKFVVVESIEEIIEKVIDYRQKVLKGVSLREAGGRI